MRKSTAAQLLVLVLTLLSSCKIQAAPEYTLPSAPSPAAQDKLLFTATRDSGCLYSNQDNDNLPSNTAVTFTDDLDQTITVSNPQKVAALLGSFAQIWELSGGTVCAAPDDAWTDLHLDLSEDAVNLGSIHSLNLELLLGAQPDLVLASTNTPQHIQWKETLEAAGITAAYFDVNDFEDYLRLLNICTEITGQVKNYETYGLAVQQQIQAVIEHSQERLKTQPAPAVLCLAASASGLHTKNSAGSVLSRILQNLGCINLADSNTVLLEQLSIEVILKADPDYIFIIPRGDNIDEINQMIEATLTKDPAWSSLSAVKENRVYFMEKDLFNLKPNERWGEAYEKAEEILSHEE